jgi:hypothetical protein
MSGNQDSDVSAAGLWVLLEKPCMPWSSNHFAVFSFSSALLPCSVRQAPWQVSVAGKALSADGVTADGALKVV